MVDAALSAGVRDVVVTHPEFTSQDLSIDDQGRWPSAARCSSAASRPPTPASAAGSTSSTASAPPAPERNLLSTDLGQPANPPVVDGLALFADRLLEGGFTDEEIQTMSVDQSVRLAA